MGKEPLSAAIWSGATPLLSALFRLAPLLSRSLTIVVDPRPCIAKIRGVAPKRHKKE